jgi:hypothetical protein
MLYGDGPFCITGPLYFSSQASVSFIVSTHFKKFNKALSMCKQIKIQYWPDKIQEVLD